MYPNIVQHSSWLHISTFKYLHDAISGIGQISNFSQFFLKSAKYGIFAIVSDPTRPHLILCDLILSYLSDLTYFSWFWSYLIYLFWFNLIWSDLILSKMHFIINYTVHWGSNSSRYVTSSIAPPLASYRDVYISACCCFRNRPDK